MRNRSFTSRKKQAGYGLLEIVIAVALVAILIGVVMYFAGRGTGAVKAGTETNYFTSMLSDSKKLFQEQGDFVGVTPTVLINSGAVPPKMVSGTTIRSGWGSTVLVAAANYNGGTSNAISFTYPVPMASCSDFASGAAAAVARVTVGGTTVKDVSAGTTKVNAPALSSACAAGTTNVSVVLTESI